MMVVKWLLLFGVEDEKDLGSTFQNPFFGVGSLAISSGDE